MDIYFVRHAQGQHLMNPPASLHIVDPPLTDAGQLQAKRLSETFPLSPNDVLIVSPLRRTIETALYWAGDKACKRIVHPLVGPRMFPTGAGNRGYNCDQALAQERIANEFPQLNMADVPPEVWERGINSMSDEEFSGLAHQFIMWCKSVNRDRIYIVSHDGTITAYRQYLGETVTRKDFLGDTGWCKAIV